MPCLQVATPHVWTAIKADIPQLDNHVSKLHGCREVSVSAPLLLQILLASLGCMQVATPRVRTAIKAEIPQLDDHVSKLQAVGVQTQSKLQDIQAAAASVGVYDLQVPENCVTKGMSAHAMPREYGSNM